MATKAFEEPWLLYQFQSLRKWWTVQDSVELPVVSVRRKGENESRPNNDYFLLHSFQLVNEGGSDHHWQMSVHYHNLMAIIKWQYTISPVGCCNNNMEDICLLCFNNWKSWASTRLKFAFASFASQLNHRKFFKNNTLIVRTSVCCHWQIITVFSQWYAYLRFVAHPPLQAISRFFFKSSVTLWEITFSL